MNDVLLQAMLKCAKEYNPRDITDWIDKNLYTKISIDLAVMLKHMGYDIVKTTKPAKAQEPCTKN